MERTNQDQYEGKARPGCVLWRLGEKKERAGRKECHHFAGNAGIKGFAQTRYSSSAFMVHYSTDNNTAKHHYWKIWHPYSALPSLVNVMIWSDAMLLCSYTGEYESLTS